MLKILKQCGCIDTFIKQGVFHTFVFFKRRLKQRNGYKEALYATLASFLYYQRKPAHPLHIRLMYVQSYSILTGCVLSCAPHINSFMDKLFQSRLFNLYRLFDADAAFAIVIAR